MRPLFLLPAALLAVGCAGDPDPDAITGIVALDDCSGSVVRFDSAAPGDQALVLTNGHCIDAPGFLSEGQAIAHRSEARAMDILDAGSLTAVTPQGPASFDPSSGVAVHVTSTELVYATMTDTDVALYRLSNTYDDLEQHGVQALTIAPDHAAAGTSIQIWSGFWRAIYACSIDGFVHELHEDQWIWKDSIRYKQPGCQTIGGTSGSPVIDADTHELVGINNTGNDSGEQCTFDNPCEVDENGQITVTQGAAYGEETYLLYACFTDGELDLTKAGCTLTRPAT
jgi:hypothetical protein